MKYFILILSIFALITCNTDNNGSTKGTSTSENYSNLLTYCNPIDIDYSYMSHYAYKDVSYRSGADPAVVRYKDGYYMFVTRSHGYWFSKDLSNWEFITPQSWYFNGSNAPAAWPSGDDLLVIGDPSGSNAVIKTDNPKLGDWKTTYSVIPHTLHDPAIFIDDDKRVYVYEGSSNLHPIKGMELDPNKNYVPVGEIVDLITLHPEENGWERFGQNHNSDIKPFIEGPWMTKHKGKYYLQYAAPGTQWNVYGDGVYVGDSPLGPFEYAAYNPVSYKPGGFLNGAGHGSSVEDFNGNYWHIATMPISVNYKFERRLGMHPAGFEEDGQMYVNTAYGDYPHYIANSKENNHKNSFTGWMLLSYNKKVETNSKLVKREANIIKEAAHEKEYMPEILEADYAIDKITDENIRTFWVSESNNDSIYVTVDLGEEMNVKAVQINFHDFNSDIFGRPTDLKNQFILEASIDKKNWEIAADYSKNLKDQPHAYIPLKKEVNARYVRYKHVYSSNKNLAISEFRIFGKGFGTPPQKPSIFEVERQKDKRDAILSWEQQNNAQGYVLYWGIAPDKLNNSVFMYGSNSYKLKALSINQSYYFQVEAFNENGISNRSNILKTE
jgi:xylan 1,4-beta-xylosidase